MMKTTKAKKMNEYIKSVVVLTAICLVITTALALVNSVTEPVIATASAERTQASLAEVMPDASEFEEVDSKDAGFPERVSAVYKGLDADGNSTGYVFILLTPGYGGDMEIACSIGSDGLIIACRTNSQNETNGLGSKTAESPYKDQYTGEDSSLAGVDSISGATISSNAYKNAILDAFTAFDMLKEAE